MEARVNRVYVLRKRAGEGVARVCRFAITSERQNGKGEVGVPRSLRQRPIAWICAGLLARSRGYMLPFGKVGQKVSSGWRMGFTRLSGWVKRSHLETCRCGSQPGWPALRVWILPKWVTLPCFSMPDRLRPGSRYPQFTQNLVRFCQRRIELVLKIGRGGNHGFVR
jgi:hypothetical protein